ncbi:MAG: hypothetical protein WCR42_14555 [bacterium]
MEVSRNYKAPQPGITILAVVLLICIILISNYFTNKNIERLTTEYKYVENKMQVFEIVKNFETNKGCSHIETVSGKKIWIAFADNYNYSPCGLDEFLQNGDTIIKHRGSDTLYIHRNKKEYYFVLKGNVGNDPCKINVEKWFKK